MLPEEDLEEGGLRMLEVDNRVILPELTHVRFVITSSDVIHKSESRLLILCTRTKFRGSPKALVTKVPEETWRPA
jgi:hypothetical protein